MANRAFTVLVKIISLTSFITMEAYWKNGITATPFASVKFCRTLNLYTTI
jgi:hypothetical protein